MILGKLSFVALALMVPGNAAEPIRPGADGSLDLATSRCRVSGKTLQYMPEDRALGYWNSADDRATWSVELEKGSSFEVWFEWSCAAEAGGNGFVLSAGSGPTDARARLEGTIPSTQTWQNHETARFGTIELPAGASELVLEAKPPIRVALGDIRAVRLVPKERGATAGLGPVTPVGLASVDITPDYPVRLTGYGNRQTESEGVTQKLRARAMAIGADPDVAVLVTVDNLGVPGTMTDEVARRLGKRFGLAPERLALLSSHTHTGPALTNVAPSIFEGKLSSEHQEHVDRYTRELTDRLEKVAAQALEDRKPGRLARTKGRAGFAANRRVVKWGKAVAMDFADTAPVDRSLPLMLVTDADGGLRAVFLTYACHCTTLEGNFNSIAGDWLGYAAEAIERDHPGVVALIGVGCGADANPKPRGTLDMAQAHGAEIARAVDVLIGAPRRPLPAALVARAEKVELPFAKVPTEEELRKQAGESGHRAHRAQLQLERLAHGENLSSPLEYRVATWSWGDELTMIFLAGEVVVDYFIRANREFDPTRVWTIAYANDVPCYIPSDRILREGGYEADDSMIYWNRPARLANGAEDRIFTALKGMVPAGFSNAP